MELREAIEHARAVAEGCPAGTHDCAYQHDKLADWLEELEKLREVLGEDYNLDRLKELVEADRAGQCVIHYEPNCLKCHYRHKDNGNCTIVGGFCTAVPAAHCPLIPELFARIEEEKAKRNIMSIQKPLTLNKLRQMDGKPVRVVYDEAAVKTTPGLEPLKMVCLVEYEKTTGYVVLRNNIGGKNKYYSDEELKQDGLSVYPYELPNFDRSMWEPCECCREQDRQVYKTQDYPGICSFEVAQDGANEIVVNAFNHNTPLTEEICFSFPALFCPKCGRPLTNEAWKMLEERLMGNSHTSINT